MNNFKNKIGTSEIGLIILNMKGEITHINRVFKEITGYKEAGLMGEKIFTIISRVVKKKDREKTINALTHTLKGKIPKPISAVFQLKDKSEIVMNIAISLLYDSESKPENVLLILHNISTYVQLKAALKESEEKYKTLTSQLPTGVYRTTKEGKILYANPALVNMLEYDSVEDLLKTSVVDTYVDNKIRKEQIKQCRNLKGIICNELTLQTKKGKQIWVRDTGRVILDEKGNIQYMDGTLEDITERKKTEEALRESEKKYRTLFEESKDIIFITTTNGNFIDINPAGVELLGYSSKKEFLKIDFDRKLYLNTQEKKNYIEQIVNRGFIKDHELILKRKDGKKVTLLVTANAVVDINGKITGYRGIMRDVTEQRKLEQQLIQSQKIEAIGMLTSGIAHDFNNLLTSIIGYAEMAQMKLTPKDPALNYVKHVLKAADHAKNFTQQLLSFSQKSVDHPKILNLNHVLKNFENVIQKLLGERIKFNLVFEKNLRNTKIDPNQIEQIIMNLASNSRDAIPERGNFTVKTKNVEVDKEYIKKYRFMRPGQYVVLSVSDTGCGMNAETLSHIFEPFFTMKKKGEGTGLGLSTVFGIIKQNNGYITVTSKIGKGTTFNIYLPIVEETTERVKFKHELSEFPKGNETVLLVEDESDVREVAVVFLIECGYKVLVAESGEEALSIWEKNKDDIDLVLTDVIMPEMSGRELVDKLLIAKSDLKIVYMSGYTQKEITQHGATSKDISFIQKPFNIADLAIKVRKALDS